MKIFILLIGLGLLFSCSNNKSAKAENNELAAEETFFENNTRPEEKYFHDENYFTSIDYPTAIEKLGVPIEKDEFNSSQIYEFRVGILNFFSTEADMIFRELTWDISEDKNETDTGKQRLTIWYARKKDMQYYRDEHRKLPDIWNKTSIDSLSWLPVDFAYWDTDMEF